MSEPATSAASPESRVSGKARVALLYLALTVLLAYPLSVRPGRLATPGDPDTDLFMWTLAWDTHALVTRPLSIFDANIFHPYRNTLAYSENLIGSAPFAAPVLWLTGNPLLALNFVALLSVVLCGLGAYVLARRVGVGTPGAVLCGMVFAFAPPRFFRLGQLHLTTVQWVPFCLASLHTYLDQGRARDLRLAVGFFALQALTSGHGAVFLTVSIVLLTLLRAVTGEPVAITRRLRDAGIPVVLLTVLVALVFLPYRSAQVDMGLKRILVDWEATPQSFLASSTHVHAWVLSLVPNARIQEKASGILFPGYLPILLAIAALIRRGPRQAAPTPAAGLASAPRALDRLRGWLAARRRDAVAFYGVLTLVAVWLSAPGPVGLWPLVYWLPGLNFVRVPARFMILATLGLAVLAGFGFERLTARLRTRWRCTAAVLTGVLLVAEFNAIPFYTRRYRVQIPAVDRWLAGRPKPFVVAELPVWDYSRLQSTYMLHTMAHWQRTVHGYSGWLPELHKRLYADMRRFPDETSLRKLSDLGVTYVVVHTDYYRPGEWPAVEPRFKKFSGWLTLEFAEGAGRVYALRPPPGGAPP